MKQITIINNVSGVWNTILIEFEIITICIILLLLKFNNLRVHKLLLF